MTLELDNITGELIEKVRKSLHMGRDPFAQHIGIKSSAVWRMETKNNFNSGEKEYIYNTFVQLGILGDESPTIPQPEIIVDTPEVPPVVFVQPETTTISPSLPSPPVIPIPDVLTPSTEFTMPTLTPEQALAFINQDSTPVDLKTEVHSLLAGLYKRVHEKHDDKPIVGKMSYGYNTGSETLSTILDAPKEELSPSPRELTAQDGIVRYSNSELTMFKQCRRRWWLTYERNLTLRSTSVFGAANTGLRVHRALQHYYVPDGQKPMNVLDAHALVIADDWDKIISASGQEGVSPDVQIAFNKAVDLEKAMLEGYVEWLAETGADSEIAVIAPEQYVEADLPNTNVKIIGRLDVQVRRKSDGFRGFLDHKTMGSFNEAVRLLPLNEQMLTYILLESLQSDTPVFGALYNMIRRVKRTATAKPPFYDRVEVHHNKWEIENFTRRLQGTIADIEVARDELNTTSHHSVVYPTPTRDCTWKCEFFQICPMFDDGSRVEAAIPSLYKEHDPYHYYAQPIAPEGASD